MLIKILPDEVVNQIAAGEVVERPAHLVKELVENSLDAGASRIEVDFSMGGRRVKVLDDGLGVSAEDLPLSIARFATSKIQNTEDIWKLSSYGFRGEALSSISAVSEFTIQSKREEDAEASQLFALFGKIQALERLAGAKGTTVLVDRLFENVPARLKFMKSESGEHTQIKNVLKALALSRPDVEFRVLESSRLLWHWPKDLSLQQRAQRVLGNVELFSVEKNSQLGSVQIVFSSPHQVEKTNRNLWFFINNRWVQDRSLQAAVMEAYRNLLMHREFPTAVVNLNLSPESVDVNIHPTKSQVKFYDQSAVFRFVQGTLREALELAPWQKHTQNNSYLAPNMGEIASVETQNIFVQENLFQKTNIDNHRASFSGNREFSSINFKNKPVSLTDLKQSSIERLNTIENIKKQPEKPGSYWSCLQVLGQAQLTYIICQSEAKLILVDQHAAHERVLFERLMRSWKESKIDIQDYLFPISLELNAEQNEALLREKSNLQNMGIGLEELGPNLLGLSSAPAILKDSAVIAALIKMANQIVSHGGSFQIQKSLSEVAASMACHSAIRAGQAMNIPEMQELLVQMDEFPLSGFCPHGRPVSVDWDFNQIEKDFGRI